MKNFRDLYIVALLIIFTACQNNNKEQQPDADLNADSKSTSNSCSCLEDYNGDATFFDSNFIAEIAGASKPKIEKAGSGKYIYYNAIWEDNGLNNFLSLENLETFSEIKDSYPYVFKDGELKTLVDYVKKTYRNQSDEETAKNAAILNEQYEKNNKDNPLAKESEGAKNKLQNTVLDMEQNAYIEIENLGDYATFNQKTQRLFVVCGDVFFELGGQVGPWGNQDKEKGKALAIKGAKKIINICSLYEN